MNGGTGGGAVNSGSPAVCEGGVAVAVARLRSTASGADGRGAAATSAGRGGWPGGGLWAGGVGADCGGGAPKGGVFHPLDAGGVVRPRSAGVAAGVCARGAAAEGVV
ncbi:MAG: hypothetical protein ACJ8AF_04855 [Gemmatimonadaceae bacterium]